jgi:small subunit ribosomal protein S16
LGRTHAPFYQIVAADSRSPRDGKFLEKIGTYDPLTEPASVTIDAELALKWLKNGAQPTDTVRSLLSKDGILLQLHLIRKNKSPEEIEAELTKWRAQKEAKIQQLSDKKATIKADQEAARFKQEQTRRQERADKRAARLEAAAKEAAANAEAAND